MRLVKKSAMVGILVIGLSLGGAVAANAGTTLLSFSVNLPQAQLPVTTAGQTKAITNMSGLISDVRVGGGYKMNAKQCVNGYYNCGTQVFSVTSAQLPNTHAAGTTNVKAQLWTSSWTVVDVSASGWWASN